MVMKVELNSKGVRQSVAEKMLQEKERKCKKLLRYGSRLLRLNSRKTHYSAVAGGCFPFFVGSTKASLCRWQYPLGLTHHEPVTLAVCANLAPWGHHLRI